MQNIRDAANDVTRVRTGLGFSPDTLLNALGLEGAEQATEHQPSFLKLGDGAWDHATGGGIAVQSQMTLDGEERLRQLVTKYVAVNPNGVVIENRLIELKLRLDRDVMRLREITFMGRRVDPKNHDHVARVFGILQHIHSDIRNLEMPDLGRIVGDFYINGMLGENVHFPGLSLKGGFDFKPSINVFTDKEVQPLRLPSEFVRELLGLGNNNIDQQAKTENVREKPGLITRRGVRLISGFPMAPARTVKI